MISLTKAALVRFGGLGEVGEVEGMGWDGMVVSRLGWDDAFPFLFYLSFFLFLLGFTMWNARTQA